MNRCEWERRDGLARRAGQERRERMAELGAKLLEDRRQRERRARLDSAKVAHWIARFDAARLTSATLRA